MRTDFKDYKIRNTAPNNFDNATYEVTTTTVAIVVVGGLDADTQKTMNKQSDWTQEWPTTAEQW